MFCLKPNPKVIFRKLLSTQISWLRRGRKDSSAWAWDGHPAAQRCKDGHRDCSAPEQTHWAHLTCLSPCSEQTAAKPACTQGAAICPDYFACPQHQPIKPSQFQVPGLVFLHSTVLWQLCVPKYLKPRWRSFTCHCVVYWVSLATQAKLVMEALVPSDFLCFQG